MDVLAVTACEKPPGPVTVTAAGAPFGTLTVSDSAPVVGATAYVIVARPVDPLLTPTVCVSGVGA